MNIVYKLTFINRLKTNIRPYYYIGSKSNCSFVDGVIVDNKTNKPYFGSSKYKNYKSIVNNDEIKAPPCSICQAKPPLYICHQAKSHGAHAKAGWSHDNFLCKKH